MRMMWIRCLLVMLIPTAPIASAALQERKDLSSAKDLFEDGIIPKLRIELSKAALDRLRQHPRTYVLATVREGNVTYTNVSIRLKGGPGSFRPVDDKPAFTLNFGRRAPQQKFHGLKKLHLNNSVQDATYLGEKISRELFEAAGVPTPQAGHAWVEFNGDHLGFYVLIEGIDKHFLRRSFTDTGGNLYDGHSQSDVTRRMRTNSGDQPENRSRLTALAAAAQEPDLQSRLTKLDQTLDVDRFMSFLASEVMLCHWDGYAMNRNNFRIYHDRTTDRMVFLPQGLDQVFQRQGTAVFPPMAGFVARSALEIPELRERYRGRMTELLTNVWQLSVLTNRVTQIGRHVQASLAQVDPQAASGYMSRVSSFNRRLQQRVRILERALLAARQESKFDSAGVLTITNWQTQIDTGDPVMQRENLSSGNPILYISAPTNAAASWRTRVALDPGFYRFQGRIRLRGVKLDSQDPKAGVGLRISRQKFGRPLVGDLSWTTVSFDFEVAQERLTVELVCELRADQGEAWFDQGSLRLIRQE